MRISLIGGSGLLGRRLQPLLSDAGHEVVVSSRAARGEDQVKADLETGRGLAEAVRAADVVAHLASDARKPQKVDVAGTRRLLDAMGNQHLVYMSIVGVDQQPFSYYQAKHQAERLIEKSGVRHSILRATQFHDFVAFFLGAACKPPVALIPKRFVFQPIDTGEVAQVLAELIESRKPGLQPDLGGPAVHTAEYLARTLMEARGREKPMLNLPVFGKAAAAFKAGVHTNPDRALGTKTWEEYLAGSS